MTHGYDEFGNPRKWMDSKQLPLFSSAGSAGSEEDDAVYEPYFPSRLSEIWYRLKYVFTYPI